MPQQKQTLTHDFLKESTQRKYSMPGSLDQKNIGLELEILPFFNEENRKTTTPDIVNEELSGTYDRLYENSLCQCSLFNPDKKLEIPRLDSKSGGIVTFEPGGQIEYSSSVGGDLHKVIQELILNFSELEHILSSRNVRFMFGALNPWKSVDEVGLRMMKPRYRAMDRYFQSIGPYGQQMMRLSTSLQVNLDFGDPETAEKRWWASNLISPLFCAMFANSPFMGGKSTGYKSYRTIVWQNLDPCRTGFPHLKSGIPLEANATDHYLQFALKADVFRLPDKEGFLGFRQNHFTFQKWINEGYNGYYPSIEDWDIHLTTLFPDVRPKGFLECRFIDGQSKPCWAVPAILATALLYDAEVTERIIELLGPHRGELDQMTTNAAKEGVVAFPDLCRELFEMGLNGSQYEIDSELLAYCENFYKHYTYQERNPADELLAVNDQSVFSVEQYRDYESRLFDLIQPPATVATDKFEDLSCGCDC